MFVYRIAKMKERAMDLSGKGAFLYGGRWNAEGVFMLYTSRYASLALLEVLVHADESELPPQLFISQLEISETTSNYPFPEAELPRNWREPDNLSLKKLGDRLMHEMKYLGFQVPSAVLPGEYNFLLNPLFPGYADLVRITRIDRLDLDPWLF
jgi:RES domain-containing protein